MNITVAENAGFCPGVKRADITIRRLIENKAENEKLANEKFVEIKNLIENYHFILETYNLLAKVCTTHF